MSIPVDTGAAPVSYTHLDVYKRQLLKDVVKEELPLDTLLREYQQVMAGEDSAVFARMYQISETSGLVIDGHICLYHCDPCPVWVRFEEKQWAYMSGRKSVSYTHLDVYKRQPPARPRSKSG